MITESNKNIRKRVEKEDRGIPVYDKAGAPLKLRKKDYGKVEHNPFQSPEYYKMDRGNFNRALSSKRFEYDFAEINRIIDTESLVSHLFSKKKFLILKDKPLIKSLKEENAEYIHKRITEMEYVSGVTLYELLETMVESLVNYNNVFILKNRNEFSSSGNTVEDKPPIASLHVLSPARLKPIVNIVGETIGYTYQSRGNSYETINIKAEDVYHLHRDKKIDVSVGTPLLESVKDDILSLRQIEESIERLIYKNASPLIHTKVGTDQFPAGTLPNGMSEIDYYANLMNRMEDEGGMVTSHRVDMKMLGAESLAIRIREYAEYFKSRVLSGLRASMLDIGQSGTISTGAALHISNVFKEDVEAYQKVLERFFTTKLFNDLLLESPKYKGKQRVPYDEEVALGLINPDKNAQIKYESHLANLVRFGLLSPEEFGRETGRDTPTPMTEVDTYQSSSDGTFSAVTSPVNQHTISNVQDSQEDYDILDELINAPDEKLFSKVYYFIEDNLKDYLKNEDTIDLAQEIASLIIRYRDLGIDSETISKVITGVIEEMILDEDEEKDDE